MSLHRHEGSVLPGYNGPFFLTGVTILNDRWASRDYSLENLLVAAVAISGYTGITTPHSSFDGYHWYGVLHFEFPGAEVCVAFPYKRDATMADGSPNDRSIALYTLGWLPAEDLNALVLQIDLELSKQ